MERERTMKEKHTEEGKTEEMDIEGKGRRWVVREKKD
jgi:hypothetical protein